MGPRSQAQSSGSCVSITFGDEEAPGPPASASCRLEALWPQLLWQGADAAAVLVLTLCRVSGLITDSDGDARVPEGRGEGGKSVGGSELVPRKFILWLIFTRLLNLLPGVTGQVAAPCLSCLGGEDSAFQRKAKRKHSGHGPYKRSQDTGIHPAGVRARKSLLASGPALALLLRRLVTGPSPSSGLCDVPASCGSRFLAGI